MEHLPRVAAKWLQSANGCSGSECRSPIKLGSRKGSSGWIFTADLLSWCCHQLGEFSAASWCFGWKSRVSSNKSIVYWSVFHQFWTIVYLTTFLILDLLSQDSKHAPISPWHGLHQLREQGLHVLVLWRFETLPFSDMPWIAAIMFVSTELMCQRHWKKNVQNKPEPHINKSQICSSSMKCTTFSNFLSSSIFAFAKLRCFNSSPASWPPWHWYRKYLRVGPTAGTTQITAAQVE